jgi:dihydroxyacetone kinase-like protein
MSDQAVRIVQRAVMSAADALESACDELCRLDAAAGDGDHGLSMAAAAKAIRSDLTSQEPANLAELIATTAKRFSAVGGTMGALCCVLIEAVGQAVSVETAPFSAAQLAHLLAVGEAALTAFGGAKRGDKTIIDAIAPARDAAEKCAQQKLPPIPALLAAGAAAQEGAISTAGIIAQVGRASRLGERSLGVVDPGAMSFAIALNALVHSYIEDMETAVRESASPPKLEVELPMEVDHEATS